MGVCILVGQDDSDIKCDRTVSDDYTCGRDNGNTVLDAATLHDTTHRYETSAVPSALAARRAFFAAFAAAAFAFFASAFAA